ncbi:GxxExxY protein [Draconibacterium halophilum]|uniref:GxxExxY protein n=1 Tax=Draconibacterium halophilum TaxID=2706887 RepID=A0A6C0REH5_9BACT|nr:GxxExxY protein [Draconibacterium halophilum]QIA08539.1 GxxExxY protein [Draconibacterium halophilum]
MNLLENQPLLYKEESYKIIGACMEVHKTLGCGFLEAVYQEALAIEFAKQNIPFEKEVRLNIQYKGTPLSKEYIADFICHESIIIELKALSKPSGEHTAQVLNYLKATGFQLGLLVNFGSSSLQYKRVVL